MTNPITRLSAYIRRYIDEHLPTILVTILVLAFLLLYFWSRIFITIKAGEGGVLYKRFDGGTVVETLYGEGFHIVLPWNVMAVYNLRVQTQKHTLNVLTEDGLNVKINMAIRYHPDREMVGVLHKYVGEDYFNTIVLPEIESTVRSYVVKDSLTNIYATLAKKTTFQDAVNEAIGRVARKFITVDEVMVIDIDLPDKIENVIQDKLRQQQLSLAYGYRIQREEQEAERKRIEAEGIRRYNAIIDQSISGNILKWQGIQATAKIATSANSKVIMIGPDKNSLPVILNAEPSPAVHAPPLESQKLVNKPTKQTHTKKATLPQLAQHTLFGADKKTQPKQDAKSKEKPAVNKTASPAKSERLNDKN
ncbi:peptidase [Pseudoalteromonas sp. MSK9-3]|uniref:prohibitin family protein n=1 Tax=Pseudoalteromonas sp. MSK9-3 TaxID=1897633 RepID=UPI000E6CA40D|nr:prohibitin family protein [Pseudoalteromonas sp. MSK9-3]RJE78154.1 peptidase [Pseudoalteromonas sp. MSK9-3]